MEEKQGENKVGSADVVSPSVPMSERKMSKKQIIGMIILVIIAVGGVVFGIFGMNSQNNEISSLKTNLMNCANAGNVETENTTVTCPDGTATEIVNNVITNELAQNLIRPFIGALSTFNNIFDHDFDDTIKFVLAFRNVNSETARNGDERGIVIPYNSVNAEYKYLFGADEDVEKKDYIGACGTFTYYGENYGALSDSFKYDVVGCGGTGGTMFSIVKNAKYSSDSLVINVYHDTAPWCQETEDDSCVAAYSLANSEAINKYIEKNNVPVYTMIFVKDDGHYVLSNIQKQ